MPSEAWNFSPSPGRPGRPLGLGARGLRAPAPGDAASQLARGFCGVREGSGPAPAPARARPGPGRPAAPARPLGPRARPAAAPSPAHLALAAVSVGVSGRAGVCLPRCPLPASRWLDFPHNPKQPEGRLLHPVGACVGHSISPTSLGCAHGEEMLILTSLEELKHVSSPGGASLLPPPQIPSPQKSRGPTHGCFPFQGRAQPPEALLRGLPGL